MNKAISCEAYNLLCVRLLVWRKERLCALLLFYTELYITFLMLFCPHVHVRGRQNNTCKIYQQHHSVFIIGLLHWIILYRCYKVNCNFGQVATCRKLQQRLQHFLFFLPCSDGKHSSTSLGKHYKVDLTTLHHTAPMYRSTHRAG